AESRGAPPAARDLPGAQVVRIEEIVDLLLVTGGVEHVPDVLLLVCHDHALHLRCRWGPVYPSSPCRDESGLCLHKGKQGGGRLGESHEREVVDPGDEYPFVEGHMVVLVGAQEVTVEERE